MPALKYLVIKSQNVGIVIAQRSRRTAVGANVPALPVNDDVTPEGSIILWNKTAPGIRGPALHPRSTSSYLFNLALT